MLELLAMNPNKVYSRENLLNIVWGYEYPGDGRTVDVHIPEAAGEDRDESEAIRSTFIQNGELVIISGVRKYFKHRIFKSLAFGLSFWLCWQGLFPG